MTIGHGYIGKIINGKIHYSDYNWLFLIDLGTEKNIKYWARILNKKWFNKKSLKKKDWNWRIASSKKQYVEDAADYHLLIEGDKILMKNKFRKRGWHYVKRDRERKNDTRK